MTQIPLPRGYLHLETSILQKMKLNKGHNSHNNWPILPESTWPIFYLLFFFSFDLGFMALSKIFHIYQANHSSKVTTFPSVSRTWLSHMWPELGSNTAVRPVFYNYIFVHKIWIQYTYFIKSYQTDTIFHTYRQDDEVKKGPYLP